MSSYTVRSPGVASGSRYASTLTSIQSRGISSSLAIRSIMFTAQAEMPERNSSPAPISSPPGSSAIQWWLRALLIARPSVPLL